MIPPKSFQINENKEFKIISGRTASGIFNITKHHCYLSDLVEENKSPLSVYAVFDKINVLRESVLLQVLENKTMINKAFDNSPKNFKFRSLIHLKYRSSSQNMNDFRLDLNFKDRNNLRVKLSYGENLLGANVLNSDAMDVLNQNDCYVMEVCNVDGIIKFIYNTSKGIQMGRPSWL